MCTVSDARFSIQHSGFFRVFQPQCSVQVDKTTNTWKATTNTYSCLMSQQHVSVSQGQTCSDNCTCCHTEMEAADQTFILNQSQYTDNGRTSPIADPVMPGAWQGSHSILTTGRPVQVLTLSRQALFQGSH